MAGAWAGGLSFNGGTDISTNGAASAGKSVTSNTATTFTKGNWTQLIASTATSTSWMMVAIAAPANAGTKHWAVDIGVGAAGSEVVIFSNMLCSGQTFFHGNTILVPLGVRAGTAVSARASCEVLNDFVVVQVHLFGDNFSSAGVSGSVDTYGFNTATNQGGVVLDPTTVVNTKGSYIQITAGLTNSISGFFLGIDNQSQSGAAQTTNHLIDVAVGQVGGENIILPNYQYLRYFTASGSGNVSPTMSPYIPIPVKAGLRVSARAQCNNGTNTTRMIGLTFYGVRQ